MSLNSKSAMSDPFLTAFVLINAFDSEDYRERKIQEEIEKLRN